MHILLNRGPVHATARVRAALGRPDRPVELEAETVAVEESNDRCLVGALGAAIA